VFTTPDASQCACKQNCEANFYPNMVKFDFPDSSGISLKLKNWKICSIPFNKINKS
jgi:hypothetical protein